MPKIEDLQLTAIQFDSTCSYLGTGKGKGGYPAKYIPNLRVYCRKLISFMNLYQKKVACYNHTAYEIMTNKIGLILPTFQKDKRHKIGIITSLVNGL